MRLLRRNGHVRPVIRLLMAGDEVVEGIYLGRWDGHYQLAEAKLVTARQGGVDKRRMDGRTAIREDKALGFQVIEEVVM